MGKDRNRSKRKVKDLGDYHEGNQLKVHLILWSLRVDSKIPEVSHDRTTSLCLLRLLTISILCIRFRYSFATGVTCGDSVTCLSFIPNL